MSNLQAVLQVFETNPIPLSSSQVERLLPIEVGGPGMVTAMIEYWVRKGKLIEFAPLTTCPACNSRQGCSFASHGPTLYILAVSDAESVSPSTCQHPPACHCR